MKRSLINLWCAIHNDYSIQKYTLGWKIIYDEIGKKYGLLGTLDKSIQFDKKLLMECIKVTKGNMKSNLESFAKELNINLETLNEKYER